VKNATRSVRLGRRGFCAAVDHPAERSARRTAGRSRRSGAAIVAWLLGAVSVVELAWILAR